MLNKICPTCNLPFSKPLNESKKNWEERHKYCSKKCMYPARIERSCKNCSKNFSVANYREYSANYCSKKCSYSCEEKARVVGEKLKGRLINPKTVFKAGHVQSPEARAKISASNKGRAPWNKGKPLPEETRKLISQKKKGMKSYGRLFKKGMPPWNKGVGTKTPEAQKARTSPEYKLWRKAVFERDNYTCVLCFKIGGKLNADHIKRFSDYPGLRFELSNGRTLCECCHRKTDTYGNRKNTESSKWRCVAVA